MEDQQHIMDDEKQLLDFRVAGTDTGIHSKVATLEDDVTVIKKDVTHLNDRIQTVETTHTQGTPVQLENIAVPKQENIDTSSNTFASEFM